MSLQVWLPLNGDLRNNGLCNCEISCNTGVAFNNDEWCSNFSNGCIFLHNPPILKMSYSFSFWIKANYDNLTNWAKIYYFGKPNTNYNITASFFQKSIYPFDYIFEQSDTEWVHVIITYNCKTNKKYLFINGELKSQTDSTNNFTTEDATLNWGCIGAKNDNSTTLSLYRFNGSLRDFRIYDHCLSVKEIKELSKGLILHYPFNNNGLGYCNPNLLTGTADGTGWSKSGFDEEEKALYRINNTTSENYIYYSSLNNIITIGKTYTFSADIKTNELVQSANMYVYDRNTKSIYKKDIGFRDNKWHHHKLTFTVKENNQADWSKAIIRFDNNASKVEGQDAVLYVKNIKLEEGSIDTAWIPNEADPEYLESLLDTSIVNDTSGFGTYGIVNGDLSYDADSPVYRASIKSKANGNYIQGAKTLPNFDNMTLSVWVYPTKSNGYAIFSDRKSNLAVGVLQDANTFIVGTNIYNTSYIEKNVPTTYNINNWHHIVLVKTTSNTFNLYVDGILTTNSNYSISFAQDSDYFQIMHRLNNNDRNVLKYFYQGKLSDLRIYSTALSEDDIKELYESKISVDKNGNVYIKNIIEE